MFHDGSDHEYGKDDLNEKAIALILILLLGFSAFAESDAGTGFTYENDPRDNPNAMKDIVVNPDAVYGFSPSPDSTRLGEYADAIDWTDPEQVAEARAQRQAYHDSMSELYRMIEDMVLEGKDVVTIARAVSQRRNELRLEVYADDLEGLALTKKSNLETYGDEMGPSADSLYEKYGSWQIVLEKALGTNPGMDACLGFYDEYYDMYDIEAAPAAAEPVSEQQDESDSYTLEQVVVLSRHNLRAPLSSNGSVPDELTPHDWIEWSAGSSELTLKGGVEETSMGQYFRKWLDREGLIPENYVPVEGEVRFNARSKQRCIATVRYFAAGMLPLADIEVEHPGDANGTEDFMRPMLHFYSDEYAADTAAAVEVEVKKATRSTTRKAKAKVEEAAAQIAEKVDAAAAAAEIEVGKAKAKRTRKTAEAKEAVETAVEKAKKPARKARAAKLDIVIQSLMGGAITPEEIAAKVPKDAISAYVKVEENKIYWVNKAGDTGDVEIWG